MSSAAPVVQFLPPNFARLFSRHKQLNSPVSSASAVPRAVGPVPSHAPHAAISAVPVVAVPDVVPVGKLPQGVAERRVLLAGRRGCQQGRGRRVSHRQLRQGLADGGRVGEGAGERDG